MNLFTLISPRGQTVRAYARRETSDAAVLGSFLHPSGGTWGNEYRLASYHGEGWAADIGAHIGGVTLALLADNPRLQVIAVEPLADNVAVLRANLLLNGWYDRCIVVEGGIGDGAEIDIAWGAPEGAESYAYEHRFIGGTTIPGRPFAARVPALRFGKIVEMAGGALDFVKWDCEGCEWVGGLVDNPEACRIIVGEWHGGTLAGLHALLDPTHIVEDTNLGGIGSFWAERKP